MNEDMSFLMVFLGGGLGSLSRFFLSSVAHWPVQAGCFPLKTFFVNMAGCLLIGFFSGLFVKSGGNVDLKNFLVAGFCGGFTTFSTFSRESVDLFLSGSALMAVSYSLLSLIMGAVLVAAGYAIAYKVAC